MTTKKMLPYVLSDLDGTLSDSSLTIAKQTVNDILAYQKKSNYHFSFITGRIANATKPLAQQLKIKLPVISCNGALISDWKTNEIFYVKYLDPSLTIELIQNCNNTGIQPVVYTETQLAGLSDNPRILMWKRYSHSLPKQLRCEILEYDNNEALTSAIEQGVLRPVQLVFYAPTKKEQLLAKEIIKRYDTQIEGIPSLSHVFNITALGANKLTGLKAFAKVLGIDYQEIVVFGDNYNDVPMVKGVKRGFVVANGVPKAKRVAYKVIPSLSENGVGETLKKFLETKIYD